MFDAHAKATSSKGAWSVDDPVAVSHSLGVTVPRQAPDRSVVLVVPRTRVPPVMVPSGSLLAWIKPCGGGSGFIGAFVGDNGESDAHRRSPGRAPAVQHCSSADEARMWVEDQAAAFGLPVKWVGDGQGP